MASGKMICSRCHGGGKIFDCSRWSASKGHCCPQGTHQISCPGKTVACAECGGLGMLVEAELKAVA
ncbi:hypothetical protein EB235_08290 [Mesorhizobium loti R88b]|uniref:Uncharacterized protein n=1 Tax=Mesorhizobium loti R88b TaxID=935548 RepID=A0A6M7WKZ6_RHILI|nr:hypothetical protein EB235_08290 [Mesorhizobium loti R88b]